MSFFFHCSQLGTHNPFQGVEPMGKPCTAVLLHTLHYCFTSALDEPQSGVRGDEHVVQSYEDLVRNYVVRTCIYHLPLKTTYKASIVVYTHIKCLYIATYA